MTTTFTTVRDEYTHARWMAGRYWGTYEETGSQVCLDEHYGWQKVCSALARVIKTFPEDAQNDARESGTRSFHRGYRQGVENARLARSGREPGQS